MLEYLHKWDLHKLKSSLCLSQSVIYFNKTGFWIIFKERDLHSMTFNVTTRVHMINGNKCWIVAGKTRRRASESPRRPKKKRKHSKSPHILHGVIQDVPTGLDSRLELFGMDGDQDLALINFERTRETLSDSCEYPQLHRSASYFPQSTAQL